MSKVEIVAEEFNKYLSYVRNLGFEDTPDYDYLRELFTTALKNTGEVEDGEYDWMKLNNGKGWEALKHHSSQHLHATNQPQNPSALALAGNSETLRGPTTPGVGPLRGKPPQGIPPTPTKSGLPKTPGRPVVSGGGLTKGQSGVTGGLGPDVPTPTISTQAQFDRPNSHLPNIRTPTNQGMGQATNGMHNGRGTTDPKPTTVQKIMKMLCCGSR